MSAYPGLAALSGQMSLDTARLRLRQFRESDLDTLAVIYSDQETMRYIGEGKTFTRGETWRAIAGMLGHWILRGYGMWALELKSTGELIGRVGFIEPEGWPGFEIGWTVARPHQGRGFATEAAAAALDHAFNALGKNRVISLIRPDNIASIRVAEKLGESPQGEIALLGSVARLYAIERIKY